MFIITSATARTVYIITALINKRSAGCAHKSARGRVRINAICTVDSKMQIRGPTAHHRCRRSRSRPRGRRPLARPRLLEGCASAVDISAHSSSSSSFRSRFRAVLRCASVKAAPRAGPALPTRRPSAAATSRRGTPRAAARRSATGAACASQSS